MRTRKEEVRLNTFPNAQYSPPCHVLEKPNSYRCAVLGRRHGALVAKSPRFFLTVAAIFKNEEHAIREWCQHYLEEGVDHIFLIDNGSTDRYRQHIDDLITAGKVTLLVDATKYNQDYIYRRQLSTYLATCEWMAILDLDEFLYGRNCTIAGYLKRLGPDIGAVRLAWKQFGSSGHIKQPSGVVQGFFQRGEWIYDGVNVKSIFRTNAVTQLLMHASAIADAFQNVSPTQPPKPSAVEAGEDVLQEHLLHLNHYQLQSREWFMSVKATRGSATNSTENSLRDAAYFDATDQAHRGISDNELYLKKVQAGTSETLSLY